MSTLSIRALNIILYYNMLSLCRSFYDGTTGICFVYGFLSIL